MSSLLFLIALNGCKTDVPVPTPPIDSPLFDLPADKTFVLDGLSGPATVVYTEFGVPHVYASNSTDMYRVQGFTVARDRFFSMDLVRRLSTGRVSSLLGDGALEIDIESRALGMTHVTDLLLANLTPLQRSDFTAYADGFNDYIAAVERGELPPPGEFVLAAPLIGATNPLDLMEPWTLRDVAAIGGTIEYRLGYETDDISRADDLARLEGLFSGVAFEAERNAGALEFWSDVTPVFDEPSTPTFGESGTTRSAGTPHVGRSAQVEPTMRARAKRRMERIQDRFGRDKAEGWGSNAWAVAGSKSTDGRALLAGDGHLELDIPALMYPIGLDTAHLGGEGITRFGNLLVGMPVIGAGTNGKVAWSSTQHSGDITDWYAEQLQLDADGKPSASFFQGTWEPLVPVDETYEIADVPALGSVGRSETWTRFTTFDGRWLLEIEGTPVNGDHVPAPGETVVALGGGFVVPSDLDQDGTITAISFDFTGFDKGNLFLLYETIAQADNVREVHQASKMSQALSQNIVAADHRGDVYYTGYEMVPCRSYLPKNADGSWIDGANPTMLLDGTLYGAFEIPVADDFTAIEGDADPYRCVVPHDVYPHSFTPERGFLLSSNQDPAGLESDGNLFNSPFHIGGPWDDGYRAHTVATGLQAQLDANQADLNNMHALQSKHTSAIGAHHLQHFLDALDHAEGISTPTPDSTEERMAALWADNQARFTEVRTRLQGWADRGHEAASGVSTFYNAPTQDDVDDAIATMIFNVWLADLVRLSIDDEGFPGKLFQGGGTAGRLRILDRLLNGRGPGNPRNLASWEATLQESVFWDVRTTDEVESSDEVFLLALEASLDFLESDGEVESGGFSTPDMNAWIWGLRHQVEFKSLVATYLDDPVLAPVFEQFQVDTGRLPLDESISINDPRRWLTWFPRPGDNRAVDAANPGLSGRRFRHGSGPVMRMGFALGPDGVQGYNVIPGGVSGIDDSPNYNDQTEKWLANEQIPMWFTVDEVLEHAQTRFAFEPQ